MAELLRCCVMLASCAECCQIGGVCARCCEEKGSPACLGMVCVLVVLGIAGMSLGLSLYYSGIASGDLANTACDQLCGSEYVAFNTSTCCLASDSAACQEKETCRQDVQKLSDGWGTTAIALVSTIFGLAAVLGICACVAKFKENRVGVRQR